MNLGEHEAMARVEERLWWYRGLRDLLARCLRREQQAASESLRVLDAGCGTGQTLRFLGQLLRPSYIGGFDISEEAIRLARRKAGDADIYPSDICDPVFVTFA